MIYVYIRVSSDKQTVENQRFEIRRYCDSGGIKVDDWIEETISGTRNYHNRKLGDLLNVMTCGDVLICSELSRLGRNMLMIMEILNVCMTRGCQVWTVKERYRLGDDIQSKVLAFAFGLAAEIERNLISQRTREALARRKSEGMSLGRRLGSRPSQRTYKPFCYDTQIRTLLSRGYSLRAIAAALRLGYKTLLRYYHTFIKCDS